LTVVIDNPQTLGALCGPNDRNLNEISLLLSFPVRTRGNEISLESSDDEVRLIFRSMLERLTEIADRENSVNSQHVRSVYASLESGDDADIKAFRENVISIPGGTRRIYPRSRQQAAYIRKMSTMDLIFSIGPAGTGKTYLAVAHALMELLSRKKRKLVLTRPVVETGENLGFLPGDLTQKLAPYLRPLYDAMEDLVDPELLERLRENGQLEVAPLAYMRGRSLKNCYVVLDEAQNTTIEQMKMFLTRLGEGSRAIVTGDPTQIDLPVPGRSGLADAVRVLRNVDGIAISEFSSIDVVRHPLVKKIIDAYESQR
jgi:phosphate starvation-inducible PhoH-like protein